MLSAIVIAKNEQEMINDCLVSLQFADEVVVVDSGSIDSTKDIARSLGAKVVVSSGRDYSKFRNTGLRRVSGDWVLYVDADERVSPLLRQEIQEIVSAPPTASAFAIPRKNYYLGKHMTRGGWGDDYVIRLFVRSALRGYKFPLHEQPVFSGSMQKLKNELTHFSHRDLTSMLDKTLAFTRFEADLRFKKHHPPVVWWRFARVMFSEFWHRFVRLSAWRDGTEGIIDGIFQVFNTFVKYAKLWEKQNESRNS
jgi:(heptosyl)LPS beta-1,4-glucosyltransferase